MNTQLELTTADKFFHELQTSNLIPVIEIETIHKASGDSEYVEFWVEIDKENNQVKATHPALTNEENESNKIAFKSVDIDDSFSLDEHLQSLHEECINSILESDFFDLV